jgi:hypothetical protein
MSKPIGAPLSNTAAQGRAREVRALLRSYVDLHYGYIQSAPGFENWRERSAKILTRAAELLAELRAEDARTGLLGAGLTGTAFERARCLEVEGEPAIAARHRGSAAETAADLAETLRTGDLDMARALFRQLAGTMQRLP